jgi:hypothetical protein
MQKKSLKYFATGGHTNHNEGVEMNCWKTVESFELEGNHYEIRGRRESEQNVYAVFRNERRVNGYTYTAHDLDVVPTDSELIALAKSDVENRVWERSLQALRELLKERS